MQSLLASQRDRKRYVARPCAALLPLLAALLALLVALHPILNPTAATWLQLAEREGESESPSPEESSQQIAPGTLPSAATSRTRRAAGSRPTSNEEIAVAGLAIHAWCANRAAQPAEIAGRNGSGGPLRC
jgi:hypothetical protein